MQNKGHGPMSASTSRTFGPPGPARGVPYLAAPLERQRVPVVGSSDPTGPVGGTLTTRPHFCPYMCVCVCVCERANNSSYTEAGQPAHWSTSRPWSPKEFS